MVKLNPARQLFVDRRFDEAVESYQHRLQEGPKEDEWKNLAGLAESLLAAGRYAEAIPLLDKVSDYQSNSHPKALGRQEQLSVCHWMTGEREQALKIIKELVVAVRDGKIAYTDISGGVSYGLILCYMAITLHSKFDVDVAMKYLKKLASRSRIQYWPGPAAQFLLGALTFGDAMKNAVDLAQTKRQADQEGWKRLHLTALYFAAGTERRMANDEKGAKMFFAECAGLTNPLIEYEWYLAKGEMAASSEA